MIRNTRIYLRLFKLYILLLCGIVYLPVRAQQPVTFSNKIKSIPGNYISFSVDNLENIYLLSATNQLKKLRPNGDSVTVFNDVKKFGEATLVDVSNPLKILLYYKGFATVVVLDAMLNLKNTIDLRRKNIFNVNAIGLSYDGKIWVYDEMDNTLKKIDDNGDVIFKTADFRQLFDRTIAPKKIYDQNRYVYLYDPAQGIYVFDYYGAYKNRIDITNWEQLRIADKYIHGKDKKSLYKYNMLSFQYDEWPIPAAFQGYRQLSFRDKKLYALSDTALEIYQ